MKNKIDYCNKLSYIMIDITSIIILTLTNSLSSSISTIIEWLFNIPRRIYMWARDYKLHQMKSVELLSINNLNLNPTDQYEHVSYYLITHCNLIQKTSVLVSDCTNIFSIYDKKTDMYIKKYETIYDLENLDLVWIKCKGKDIGIKHSVYPIEINKGSGLAYRTLQKKKFIIYAVDFETIRDFIATASQEFAKSKIKCREKNMICIYDWIYYQGGDIWKWNPNKISVKKRYKNIFLSQENEKLIKNTVAKFIDGRLRYEEFGQPWKTGYIFHGVPGCGKTSTIFAIASECDMNIYRIKLNSFKTAEQFCDAISNISAKSVVIFEEIDCCKVAKRRDSNPEPVYTKDTLKFLDGNEKKMLLDISDVLQVLDGYQYLHGCIIIMTTNLLDQIDPALTRPGRIDHSIEFKHCDIYQAQQILEFYTDASAEQISVDLAKIGSLNNMTTSHLINTIVFPNYDNYDQIIKMISKYKKNE